jgi:hypothetical protein
MESLTAPFDLKHHRGLSRRSREELDETLVGKTRLPSRLKAGFGRGALRVTINLDVSYCEELADSVLSLSATRRRGPGLTEQCKDARENTSVVCTALVIGEEMMNCGPTAWTCSVISTIGLRLLRLMERDQSPIHAFSTESAA